jgi:hypothetical protein
MRFLYTLLLSIGCFAAGLQSYAADIPVKKNAPTNEYRATGQTIPHDALNDYHHISASANAVTNYSSQKEGSVYFYNNTFNSRNIYVLNDCFKNIDLLFHGNYASIFRIKLIFPQHYHW